METQSPLRLIASMSLQFEAEHLQRVLESAGIESFIEGLHCSSNFPFNTTMGSIRLMVRGEDADRALDVIEQAKEQPGSPWHCGRCHESNEASFEICWKCGGLRSEVEVQPPAEELSRENPRGQRDNDNDFSTPHAQPQVFDPNPYATPRAMPQRQEAGSITASAYSSSDVEELDDCVTRAYKASIMGLVTLPGVLHAYSLVLLMSALGIPVPFTARQTRLFRIALAIDLIVVAAFGYLAVLIWTHR